MSELVKPTMDARLQRILQNTAKLDRLRVRESLKEERERQLIHAKLNPLPYVWPSMKRTKDSKCERCDFDKEQFTTHEDWYAEPIDALQMQIPTEPWGWFHLPNINELMKRKSLSRLMDSLVVHPAHLVMMANMSKRIPDVPLVFVLKSDFVEIDIAIVNYIRCVNGVKRPLLVIDETRQQEQTISEARVAAHFQAREDVLVLLDGEDEDGLRKVLNACGFGTTVKVYLLPVSINYERPPQTSKPLNLGIVKINFNTPYTVADLGNTNNQSGMDASPYMQAMSVTRFSKHLIYDIVRKRPIMTTNVVAFLLLTACRGGATVGDLAAMLDEVRHTKHSLDYAFEGDTSDIVERAVDLLGDLVVFEADLVKPSEAVEKLVELSKYAEPLKQHFVLESVLVIAAQSVKRAEDYIDFNTLMTYARDLCVMLQSEFQITKPCQDVVAELKTTFDALSIKEIISKPQNPAMSGNEMRARRLAQQFEESNSESEDEYASQRRQPENEVTINASKPHEVQALKSVVFPYLEAYLTVVCLLKKDLLDKIRINENEFTEMLLVAMSDECKDSNCMTWESCNRDWMKSGLKCLGIQRIIRYERFDDQSIISLNPAYATLKALRLLIGKAERFFDFSNVPNVEIAAKV